MTLYNKDGSVYKLSAPNPIIKDQQIWTKFVVHNMKWRPEYKEDGTAISPIEEDFAQEIKSQAELFLDELTTSKEDDSAEKIIEQKIEIKEDEKQKTIKSNEIEKTFIYCLPAKLKEKVDNLYGDTFKTISYDNPTSFESVILSQNDMIIEMWSEIKYEKETILYPKNGDKRWWKISEITPKLGGWIIKGIPSQDQPSFES